MTTTTIRAFSLTACVALAACGGGGASAPVIPSVTAPPAPGLIAFVGDSITAGSRLPDNPSGITNPDALSPTAYPFLVGQALGVPIVDLGIGGEIAFGAVADEVPKVPLNAATVVIYLGTNGVTFGGQNAGSVQNAENGESAVIAAVRARVPNACVLLIGLPDPLPWNIVMKPYIDAYDTFLTTLGLPILDLRTQALTQNGANFVEGVHPNVQGNADLAVSVESFLSAQRCL